jgi:hypothetical protein
MPTGAAHTFASRARLRALVLAPLAMLMLIATGCGSDSSDEITIPKENSDQLLAALNQVQADCDSQMRSAAVNAAQNFVEGVNQLPKEVGTEAKDALRDAGENLKTLAAKCESGSTGATGPVGVVPSTSTSTSTSTTTTTTSSTTTSTPTQNQGEGNGVPSGGNGNAGGNSGDGDETGGGDTGEGNGGSGGIGGGTAG